MRRLFVLGCWVALVVPSALGQDQDRPRASHAAAESRSGGWGAKSLHDVVMLLVMPEVQEELGLDEGRKKEVSELLEKTRQEMTSWVSALPGQAGDDKKSGDFSKKAEELNRKTLERLAKIFDAKQLERFQQLRLQYRGAAAMAWPDVAEKLGLTAEQREKVAKVQQGNSGSVRTPPETEERLLAVLTPAQKENWEKLRGKKFEFQQPASGGPFSGFGVQGGSDPAGGTRKPADEKPPEGKKGN